MPSGDSPSLGEIRARLNDLYPARWALGLVELCAPTPHTHRDRDGVDRDCGAPGKRPLALGWQRDAAERYVAGIGRDAHLDRIARHFARGGNVGLALPRGVVALDADTPAAAAWLHAALPRAPAQETAHGLHAAAAIATDPTNTVRVPVADGVEIDVRGVHAQIVVEPSIHATGTPYRWRRPLPADAAELPPCPVDLPRREEPGEHATRNAERIAEGARNATLTSLAGTMRRRGMSAEEIRAALAAVNTARCTPPLDDAEVRRIAIALGDTLPKSRSGRANLTRTRAN